MKKQKIYKLSDLNKDLYEDDGTHAKMETLIGKKITVLGTSTKNSAEYGPFEVMRVRLGKKEMEVATGSTAIVKVLALGRFPFEAIVRQYASKKRKNAKYFAFAEK